jgi:hypothetical protein
MSNYLRHAEDVVIPEGRILSRLAALENRVAMLERLPKRAYFEQFVLTSADPIHTYQRQVGGTIFLLAGGVAIPSSTGPFALAVDVAPFGTSLLSWAYSNAISGEEAALGMDAINLPFNTDGTLLMDATVLSGSLSFYSINCVVIENVP